MVTLSFSKEIDAKLSHAAVFCDQRGARLTDLRRQVLGLVLESAKPAGAYDLLDRLRTCHKRAAPPTIYRALDFLVEQGLVHKVERLAAFVGCVHPTNEDDHGHHHAAQFLICQQCGGVTELEERRIDKALVQAAHGVGFRLASSCIEALGTCAACAALDQAALQDSTS